MVSPGRQRCSSIKETQDDIAHRKRRSANSLVVLRRVVLPLPFDVGVRRENDESTVAREEEKRTEIKREKSTRSRDVACSRSLMKSIDCISNKSVFTRARTGIKSVEKMQMTKRKKTTNNQFDPHSNRRFSLFIHVEKKCSSSISITGRITVVA